jgi:hypothetical protein
MTSECYYCGGLYCHSSGAVGDHFPEPRCTGGTETVPCCNACHDMKDRIPFTEWRSGALTEIMNDWHKFGRYTRIFLASYVCLTSGVTGDKK